MKGTLIKKIEVRKLYHMSNYHKRHFFMDWKKGQMLVKKFTGEDDTAHKTIMIDAIRSVKVIDDEEEAELDEKGF